jgi:glyoxylase-like metal-dependent hydrolase (beta-lactamase superfamily II)
MTVEAIWVPGHSAGCTNFLVREMKTLLSGCGGASTQVGETTIENYRTAILRLVARQKEWDRIYTMHGPEEPEGSAVPVEVFERIVETCDALLRGKLRGVPVPPSTNQIYGGKGNYATTIGVPGRQQKLGNLTYLPDRILNAQE